MLEVFFKEKMMLLSIALIILTSLLFSWVMTKIKFPALIGMLLAGILLGPYLLNLIDIKILDLSPDLRQIALVVILIRAGLSLDLSDLKKNWTSCYSHFVSTSNVRDCLDYMYCSITL
jgi:NhaP-type Na+/H+ or K+/H+ antiporter